jgi:hypothetical protein
MANIPNQFIYGPDGSVQQNPEFWQNPAYTKGLQQYQGWEQDALKGGANFASQDWSQLSNFARNAAYGGQPLPAPDVSALTKTYDPNVTGNYTYGLPSAPNYWSGSLGQLTPQGTPAPVGQTPSLQNVGMPQAFTPASAPAVAQSPFGGSGSGSSSDAGSLPEWQQYMNAYPDLNPAYAKDSYGLSPEQFAQTHFDKFGHGEGRTWPGETVTDMQQPIPSAPSGPREIDPGWMGNNGMPALGAGNAYTPPAPAAGSAAATNPYLALSLNNLTQAGQFNPSVLGPLAQSMWNQANRNWSDNINPALDSSAITAGGFGGDRAALAKGVMASRMNEGIFNALAPQYVNMFEGAQNRNLQAGQAAGSLGSGLEQLDLSRLLGIGNLQNQGRQLDISQQGADTNTASAASGAAGTPTYTNPLGAGLGGALTLWQLLGLGG